ncbi:branched-chain amino acid ABC transporter permease [Bradyrhizobium niftali]|uniref:Branched-chain amino acid ABC transporter permease n=1 Tax=Bradyrhizobium niftali TaxID=2560055 RepID=A0A4Y9M7Y2_9BRAD|nr:branched-chain amino acid ABC transporter permease [Bradyrhizobium niftali]TFV51336.1 branched-chain amino acid ABC transporter permease [Bradyrhizobium niftali]
MRPAIVIFLLLLLLFAPFVLDAYTQYLVNLALSYSLVCLGLNLLLGYAGQFSFANAAFMGIGAYTYALLTSRLGVPSLVALPAAGMAATALGMVVAGPALRLSTVYLAMTSLAFAELVQWTFIHWSAVTLGTDGVRVRWPAVGSYVAQGDKNTFYVVLVVVAISYWSALRIVRSKLGRAFLAIRQGETLARCSGIDVERTKTIAYAISAFYAGIGGALFALTIRFIVPDGFGLVQLVLQFSMVLIGGLGSLLGGLVGSLLLTVMPELLRNVEAYQEMLYGVLLVLFVIFMPRGIVGLLGRLGLVPQEILVRGAVAYFDARRRKHSGL